MKPTLALLTALTAIPAAAQTIPANTYITVRTDITIDNRAIPVSTTDADILATGNSRTQTSARRGVGLGALGAGVGAIAGGGRGAAIGTAVGGGTGAATGAMPRGREMNVPSETRLRLALTSPVTAR